MRRVACIGVVNVCSDWLEYYHPSRLSTSHEANVVLRRSKLAGHFTFTYKFSQMLAYGLMVKKKQKTAHVQAVLSLSGLYKDSCNHSLSLDNSCNNNILAEKSGHLAVN